MTTQVNLSEVETYFKFLDTEKEVFCYCLLDAESKDVIKGYGVEYGHRRDILGTVQRLASTETFPPFTLHTTLNRTNLRGRKVKDIESCRVLCVDFDRPIARESLKALVIANGAHLVIESSPGKYHIYWKLSSGINITDWSTFQLGLNHYFGGDLELSKAHHTIRVPGLARITKEGAEFTPSIIYLDSSSAEMSYQSVIDRFPWVREKAEEGSRVVAEKKAALKRTVKEFKKGSDGSLKGAAREADRNNTLFGLIYSTVSSPNGDDTLFEGACQIGRDFNQALKHHPKGPLGEDEMLKTVKSAWERGTIGRERRLAREAARIEKTLGERIIIGKGLEEAIYADTSDSASPNGDSNGHGTNGAGFHYDYSKGDLALSRFTDMGLLERVFQRFGASLVRVGRSVYAFDSRERIWVPQKQTRELITSFVQTCCRDTILESEFLALCRFEEEGGEARKQREEAKWLSNRTVGLTATAVLSLADLTRRGIHEFDADPGLFYAANGVVDLPKAPAKECLRPAMAGDYLLHRAPVSFDPLAKCPYWLRFLGEVFRDNADTERMIAYLQAVFGYCLTGDNGEQTVFVHTGEGANGKSRVLRAMACLTGDYCTRLQSSVLAKTKNAVLKEVDRIGAKVEGKRVVIIDDLDTKTQWNEGIVKALTERTIIARKLYEEERDIPNHAKIHIGCNETPVVEAMNHAIMRRIRILEYPRTFDVSATKLTEIDRMVSAELPGILNWAIEGLKRTINETGGVIAVPEEVTARVEMYRELNSGGAEFIPDMLSAPENDGDWHTVQEIGRHLREASAHFGCAFECSVDSLGRILNKLGYAKTQNRKNGVKARRYNLHLKGCRESTVDKLLSL